MYELEVVRSWERNPQIYADIIGTSLAGQALFAYAPEAERARRVVSKLRQVPRRRAGRPRQHQGVPGHLRQGRARKLARHAARSSSRICRGRSPVSTTSTSSATWPTRRPRPRRQSSRYIDYLETDLAPRAKASFRLGRERFEQKLKLEDGVDLSSDRLLAIALRELRAVQEEFRKVAGRLNGGDPIEAWRKAKEQHPEPGTARRRGAGAGRGARGVPPHARPS